MWHVWERGEVHTGFWRGDLRKRHHFDHLGVDGRIILKRNLQEVGGGGRDRSDQAYDRYMWRTLVNAVINLRVP